MDNVSGPGVTVAAYGAAEVLSVVPDASKPLYSGFQTIKDGAYAAIVSGTAPDALGPGSVRRERPVAPGQTDTFTLSLRFAPAVSRAGEAGRRTRTRASLQSGRRSWTGRIAG